jgi:hypothetical protein
VAALDQRRIKGVGIEIFSSLPYLQHRIIRRLSAILCEPFRHGDPTAPIDVLQRGGRHVLIGNRLPHKKIPEFLDPGISLANTVAQFIG